MFLWGSMAIFEDTCEAYSKRHSDYFSSRIQKLGLHIQQQIRICLLIVYLLLVRHSLSIPKDSIFWRSFVIISQHLEVPSRFLRFSWEEVSCTKMFPEKANIQQYFDNYFGFWGSNEDGCVGSDAQSMRKMSLSILTLVD